MVLKPFAGHRIPLHRLQMWTGLKSQKVKSQKIAVYLAQLFHMLTEVEKNKNKNVKNVVGRIRTCAGRAHAPPTNVDRPKVTKSEITKDSCLSSIVIPHVYRVEKNKNKNFKNVVGRIRTCAGRAQWISSPSP